jgi:hypothetical protein
MSNGSGEYWHEPEDDFEAYEEDQGGCQSPRCLRSHLPEQAVHVKMGVATKRDKRA